MNTEPDETTDDATTTDDSADEVATSASPADDALSSAESSTEEIEEVEETPELVAEREKKARIEARIKVAEEAEKKAEAGREERQRKREGLEREERITSREHQANETMRHAQAMLRELEEIKGRVQRGGVEGLRALGVEYGDWTKRTLEETGPEALARQALERADRIEAELKRRDQLDADARERANIDTSKRQFESFVEENADDFESSATLPSRVLHILAGDAASEYRQENGTYPSFAALLPRLDRKAKEFHDEQKAKSAKRTRSTDTPSDGTPNTQAATNGHPASTPANRTLTPATAVTKARAPRPMTDEELEEWSLTELRTALAADAKTAKAS